MSPDPETWDAERIRDAEGHFFESIDADWINVWRWEIRRRIERLKKEAWELDVESTTGRKTFYMLKGEVRGLEQFLKKGMGMGKAFTDLEDNAEN